MGTQRPGMKILVPVVVILSYIQVPKVEGALTISKEVYGPLRGSTTLQCKDTTAVSGGVTWYFNAVNLITVDGIKYREVGIPGAFGYNLTISNLQPSDEGNYHCEIGIDAAVAIYLPIEYRPGDSDINIDDNGNIIIKSYPSPTFTVVAKNQSGTQTLNGTQSTQNVVTDNTKSTKWTRITSLSADLYTFIVTVSAPGNIIKEKNITIYDTTRGSSPTGEQCQLELRLGLGIVLGIIIVVFIICIVIFVVKGQETGKSKADEKRHRNENSRHPTANPGTNDDRKRTDQETGAKDGKSKTDDKRHRNENSRYPSGDQSTLILLIGLGIIFITSVICIVILATKGGRCSLDILLGLGISFGIIIIACIICIVISFKKVIIQNKDILQALRPDGKEVTITAIIYGFWISRVEWIRGQTILTTNGDYTIVPYDSNTRKTSLTTKSLSMTSSETYICRVEDHFGFSAHGSITIRAHNKKENKSGPPVIHIRTQNKVESETTSKQTHISERRRSLPSLGGVVDEKPQFRPQLPIPDISNIKDQNLVSKTPRPNKLPSLTPKPPAVKEEDALEEPKKKRKKKKKKNQLNEGNLKGE